jgi:hypothetical protein
MTRSEKRARMANLDWRKTNQQLADEMHVSYGTISLRTPDLAS